MAYLAHGADSLAFDLLRIDIGERPPHTCDRLIAESARCQILEQLAVALTRRSLAQFAQQLAVDLDGCRSRRAHVPNFSASQSTPAPANATASSFLVNQGERDRRGFAARADWDVRALRGVQCCTRSSSLNALSWTSMLASWPSLVRCSSSTWMCS